MELARRDLAFSIDPALVVDVVRGAFELIGILSSVDWVHSLYKKFKDGGNDPLRRLTGLDNHPIPATIGINTWGRIDDRSINYSRGNDPLPPFNDVGLHTLPAVLRDKIREKHPDESLLVSETALILGGSRISPKFMEILTGKDSGLPFHFCNKEQLKRDPPEPDSQALAKLHRGFRDLKTGEIYSKKLNVGRYVVDADNPDRKTLGPFVWNSGVKLDVLIFTILPNLHGGRTIIGNAAYGSASRIASILLDSDRLEAMLSKLGEWTGADALQAVFQVPQISKEMAEPVVINPLTSDKETALVSIEDYGEPFLENPATDIRLIKNWRTGRGETVLKELRKSFA